MLKKGDRVRVNLPWNDLSVKANIRQFHGMKTTIKEVIATRPIPQFKLVGCESVHGKDYCFLAEWLVRIDEE